MTTTPAETESPSDVRLIEAGFDPPAEIAAFSAAHFGAGGIASFIGQVRGGDDVEALELQHYAPLTLPGMEALAADTRQRWALEGLLIIHRTGLMMPCDPIVLVAAAARHRRDAFAAAEFAMDHLKSDSWFWKRERAGGQWRWIEPRTEDFDDLRRWA
ncbi:MAG: molybdenum cofactor biosynthesis protein MoaE [Novosphingobium sp.]